MSLQDDQARISKVSQLIEDAKAELSALAGQADVGAVTGSLSALKKHEHYKIYRDYIEHEDGLINNRNVWNINIQGFLFATYGLSVQKLAEIQVTHPEVTDIGIGRQALEVVIFLLPVFGCVVSLHCFLGVLAAQKAIAQLADEWENEASVKYPSGSPKLPGIKGGGVLKAHKWGLTAPKWFPITCMATWILLVLGYLIFPLPQSFARFFVR